MRAFEYAHASTLSEAVGLLGENGRGGDGTTRPLAGGTDLLTLIKADVVVPSRLIDVKRVPDLSGGIEAVSDGLALGALTTLADVERSQAIKAGYTALAEAAALAATPQLRNMATIGGNLLQRPRCWYFRSHRSHCWLKGGDDCPARDGENQFHALFDVSPCVAVHPSDLASALVAFDAEVSLRGPNGMRTLPVGELFVAPSADRRTETVVRADELLLSLRLPRAPTGTRSTYLKAMDRKVWAFALVGVAAVIRLDGRRISAARVVLSGVAPIPWRAHAAEQTLVGAEPSAELFAKAAERALADAKPLRHNGYKVPLATALIQRALVALTDGSASG